MRGKRVGGAVTFAAGLMACVGVAACSGGSGASGAPGVGAATKSTARPSSAGIAAGPSASSAGPGADCGDAGQGPDGRELRLYVISGQESCAEVRKVYSDYGTSTGLQGSGGFGTVDGWNCSHNSAAGFEQSGQMLGCQRGTDAFGTGASGSAATGSPAPTGGGGGAGQLPPGAPTPPRNAGTACGLVDNVDVQEAGGTGYLYASGSSLCGDAQRVMNDYLILERGESLPPTVDGYTCVQGADYVPSYTELTCTRGGATLLMLGATTPVQ